MTLVLDIARVALFIFFVLLFARIAILFVMSIAHGWKPRGASLLLVEAVLSATDPPVKAVRRVVPPIDLGGIRLDLSVFVLMLLATVMMSVLSAVPTGG